VIRGDREVLQHKSHPGVTARYNPVSGCLITIGQGGKGVVARGDRYMS
jgi:hypothetical protein